MSFATISINFIISSVTSIDGLTVSYVPLLCPHSTSEVIHLVAQANITLGNPPFHATINLYCTNCLADGTYDAIARTIFPDSPLRTPASSPQWFPPTPPATP